MATATALVRKRRRKWGRRLGAAERPRRASRPCRWSCRVRRVPGSAARVAMSDPGDRVLCSCPLTSRERDTEGKRGRAAAAPKRYLVAIASEIRTVVVKKKMASSGLRLQAILLALVVLAATVTAQAPGAAPRAAPATPPTAASPNAAAPGPKASAPSPVSTPPSPAPSSTAPTPSTTTPSAPTPSAPAPSSESPAASPSAPAPASGSPPPSIATPPTGESPASSPPNAAALQSVSWTYIAGSALLGAVAVAYSL